MALSALAVLKEPTAMLGVADAVLFAPRVVAFAALAAALLPTAVALIWPAALDPADARNPIAVAPLLARPLRVLPPAAAPAPTATLPMKSVLGGITDLA